MTGATLHDLAVDLRCALDLIVDARAHVGERLDADRDAGRVERGIGLDVARANIGNGAQIVRCVVEALEQLARSSSPARIGTGVPPAAEELPRLKGRPAALLYDGRIGDTWRYCVTVDGVTTETDTGIVVANGAAVDVLQIAEALGRPFVEIVAELSRHDIAERAPRLDDRGALVIEASTTGKERRR